MQIALGIGAGARVSQSTPGRALPLHPVTVASSRRAGKFSTVERDRTITIRYDAHLDTKHMGYHFKNVDDYIKEAKPFARPILKKLRELFRRSSSHLRERIKWNAPSFEYHGMVGQMAVFDDYVAWSLWKAKKLKDPKRVLNKRGTGWPHGANKVTRLSQLPPDKVMIDLIKQAVALNAAALRPPRQRVARPMPSVPADLAAALKKNPRAAATFEKFTNSNRREYIEWITTSKQPETRAARLAQATTWMNQGKTRYWKMK